MSHNRDAWVSQRAYSLWESEGRPEGRGENHWMQALKEFEQLQLTKASPDGNELIEKLKAAGRLIRVYGEPAAEIENGLQRKIAR
ncbi:DUF2934 domain-containing protein [Rhizobium lentis]|uniref:DUF2934 domain-containing protein n=1 Tax=Rhizobium lentis TaxID=1138194 RepID=A0A9Q3MFM5_9HYPH|nr:DUF2934 domain-containing protein [Rhizobium lentis]MBX4958949.1 DUF2934 domain-containing protein [Rhizobium lentis]MBX4977128.1 DUF2934 domain-containing protein [Rhizobium lentis]MBX4988955.1 DUF2934 domain-containing protein [Rhizobium lentis]MBX5000714.1 DUF2934 domain-containing protein [Rhizobium lentis]MBX5007404.1 DUF2934 domain-containing protein [Rhizobium lentis]